jgi:hypothetical protein
MTPEIVTNAIVAALSAGAVAGATDTAKSAIADAYQGLKSLIKNKFGHDSDVAEAIDKLEVKPDSDGKKKVLAEELNAVNSASESELVSAAQTLLELIRALPQGERHIQFAQGIGIAQADRGGTATVNTQPLTQAPVINVSPRFHMSNEVQRGKAENAGFGSRTGIASRTNPSKISDDPCPKLYSLPPRIVRVSERYEEGEHEAYGLTQGGETLQAVVATFRMQKPAEDSLDVYVTGRLSYRTVSQVAGKDIATEIHRINYATWLEEDFNFVEMTLTDTKELVLLVVADDTYIAVQDNRRSRERYKPLSYQEVEVDGDGIFIDVTLVGDGHGNIITYTYKVRPQPLKVHEIIRVPRQ